MKMVVGLGNPGPRYVYNRHNIGFQCIDLFAERHGIAINKMQQKARVGDGWINTRPSVIDTLAGGMPQMLRRKVLLVKPLTYMNLSGKAVGPLVRYYDIDLEDLIVVHDDLDLPPAKLRLRSNGGSGGQNGIRSIIQHLGSQDFACARVGIGRPPGRMDPANYVLKNFTDDDEADFGPLRETILDALECWLFEGIEAAMNRFNG